MTAVPCPGNSTRASCSPYRQQAGPTVFERFVMDDLSALRREIAAEVLAELPGRGREAMRRKRVKQLANEITSLPGSIAPSSRQADNEPACPQDEAPGRPHPTG